MMWHWRKAQSKLHNEEIPHKHGGSDQKTSRANDRAVFVLFLTTVLGHKQAASPEIYITIGV